MPSPASNMVLTPILPSMLRTSLRIYGIVVDHQHGELLDQSLGLLVIDYHHATSHERAAIVGSKRDRDVKTGVFAGFADRLCRFGRVSSMIITSLTWPPRRAGLHEKSLAVVPPSMRGTVTAGTDQFTMKTVAMSSMSVLFGTTILRGIGP